MKRLVEFTLPDNTPAEVAHYIGISSLGFALVLDHNKKPAAIIKEFTIKRGTILFDLFVIDPILDEYIVTGEPAPQYTWLNPVTCMLGLPN